MQVYIDVFLDRIKYFDRNLLSMWVNNGVYYHPTWIKGKTWKKTMGLKMDDGNFYIAPRLTT